MWAIVIATAATIPAAEESAAKLELRRIENESLAPAGKAVPRDAFRVFTCDRAATSVRVTREHIAVRYDVSAVLFDRASGAMARRFTVGEATPDVFGPKLNRYRRGELVGPGVVERFRERDRDKPIPPESAATVEFQGTTWRALQPGEFLLGLTRGTNWQETRKTYGTWTGVLRKLNAESYVEARSGDDSVKRFTIADGLSSNIVTHLAVAEGSLWAVCVDLYDPDRKAWGPGGLCRFDPAKLRWERIDAIDGRPVRWVTALESINGELWVAFREGSGIAGDQITYGMGLYPGVYRPQTKQIVLARLAGGRWTSFARPPVSEGPASVGSAPPSKEPPPPPAPTETPRRIARVGNLVFLFSQTQSRRLSGNWHLQWDGHVSLVDLQSVAQRGEAPLTGATAGLSSSACEMPEMAEIPHCWTSQQWHATATRVYVSAQRSVAKPAAASWRVFDTQKDIAAESLEEMVVEGGEVVVTSERGAHQFQPSARTWRYLDPQCVLVNPSLSAAVEVGDELWVGYTNEAFGVIGRQGISRYDERTGRWSWVSPKEIGTSAPLRRIVAMPDAVWVLFLPRPWGGAAMEFPYFNEERGPTGLGRFVGGKWEFPVALDGVPASRKRSWKGPDGAQQTYDEQLPIEELAAAAGRLFVANRAGIYEGPGKWKQIAAGPALKMEPSPDGARLLYYRQLPAGGAGGGVADGESRLELCTLDPATGKITAEKPPKDRGDYWQLMQGNEWLFVSGSWTSTWLRLPSPLAAWALGELESNPHRVVITRKALWIASRSQLIRLDRQRLDELLGK
jgi:hypothetical protein